jgi:hypothetical protein
MEGDLKRFFNFLRLENISRFLLMKYARSNILYIRNKYSARRGEKILIISKQNV